MVYGIQGTGQSSPDADPNQDAGFLSRVLAPAMREAGEYMDRAYVPYDAGFGGAVPGGTKPYADSVDGAVTTAEDWIKDKAADCPATKFGLVGYSQGAHAVRVVLNNIVNGKTAINADQLALVANFGDPGRPQGAPLFPGRPGQSSPSPVPGTVGDAVSQVVAAVSSTPQGGGIAPAADVTTPLTKQSPDATCRRAPTATWPATPPLMHHWRTWLPTSLGKANSTQATPSDRCRPSPRPWR